MCIALPLQQRDFIVQLLATELPMAKAEGAVSLLRQAPEVPVYATE